MPGQKLRGDRLIFPVEAVSHPLGVICLKFLGMASDMVQFLGYVVAVLALGPLCPANILCSPGPHMGSPSKYHLSGSAAGCGVFGLVVDQIDHGERCRPVNVELIFVGTNAIKYRAVYTFHGAQAVRAVGGPDSELEPIEGTQALENMTLGQIGGSVSYQVFGYTKDGERLLLQGLCDVLSFV